MPKNKSPIEIHLLEHNTTNNDWVAIKAARRGGRPPEYFFTKAEDFHDKRKLANLIAQKSLDIGDLDPDKIIKMLPDRVGTLTEQPGWTGPPKNRQFVLFDHIVTDEQEQCCFYLRPEAAQGLGQIKGDIIQWKSGVAKIALKSYLSTVGLLASFAAPLLPLIDDPEGAIINLVAKSSSGKSSINKAAYSVWGNPKQLPSWGGSDASIMQAASAHNALICPLDDGELAEIDPQKRNKKLHALTHTLADGIPKRYSKAVQQEHESPPFYCFTISSNPSSIESSFDRTDGDRARFLELSAPSGDDGGIWAVGPDSYVSRKGDASACAKRSKQLVTSALENYGVAGKAYIQWLEENYEGLEERISELSEEFLSKYFKGLGGVRRRMAEKFALMYVGGIFAIEAGILPTKKYRVAKACQYAINEAFQMAFPRDLNIDEVIDSLDCWFDDQETFPSFDARNKITIDANEIKAGFYIENESAVYVRLEAFEAHLAEKFGSEKVSRDKTRKLLGDLANQKFFSKPNNGNLTKDVRVGSKNQKIKLLKFVYEA